MTEYEKISMKSPDLNRERLETLKTLFPDLFSVEGKLNPDELAKIAGTALSEKERFEFKWFGKANAKRNAFTPSPATLLYDENKSMNPEHANGNLIIEGENLQVLKCLLSAYREKIKCIYIDPPYNTGKDFVYSDSWDEKKETYWEHIGVTSDGVKVDSNTESEGRYHSNWLNMLFPRLLLARQLLREDGVIFISIDDNEVHHLRKICDEVFGEENFVTIIPWRKRTAKSDVPFGVSQDFEWILMFAKSSFNAGRIIERKYYSSNDFNERWRLQDLTKQCSKEERANSFFTLVNPRNGMEYPANPNRVWAITRETFKDYYSQNKIVFPGDYDFINNTIPAFRVFENEDKEKNLERFGTEESIAAISTLLPQDVGRTEDGTKEIDSLFHQKIFPFSKPSSLIKHLFSCVMVKDDIYLDFFAGSGTTGQAVMDLNREDGGNRKFILVQIPELTDKKSEAFKAGYKKISDITIERNKRVIQKFEKEAKDNPDLFNGKGKDGIPNCLGFKVYKLAKSNFPRVDFISDPEQPEEKVLPELKKFIEIKEKDIFTLVNEKDIYDEVMLKNGFMLNYTLTPQKKFKQNKVYLADDGYKKALVCLDAEIKADTIGKLDTENIFICLERSIDTTRKWNLKKQLGEKLLAF